MDEILICLYESDIQIQNINYQLLSENYELLKEGFSDKISEKWKSFKTAVKDFFKRVLEAMRRAFAKLVVYVKPLRKAYSILVQYGFMKDSATPDYNLLDIQNYANGKIENISLKEYDTYTFDKYLEDNGEDEKSVKTLTYEIDIIESYKNAIGWVKTQEKKINDICNIELNAADYYKRTPEERQQLAKEYFSITKLAIKLIQERTKISVDYILKLSSRATKAGIKLALGKQEDVDNLLKDYGVEFKED